MVFEVGNSVLGYQEVIVIVPENHERKKLENRSGLEVNATEQLLERSWKGQSDCPDEGFLRHSYVLYFHQ